MAESPKVESVVVWDRTSGAEDEEQDAKAQAATTRDRAVASGFEVVDFFWDEDKPGDLHWDDRPEMKKALRMALARGFVFLTRSPSRLWRGRPAEGLRLAQSVPDLEVLGKPHWKRRAGVWVDDSDAAELYRFLDLWQAWTGKRGIREETQLVMTAIKRGERPTRSGKPHHRPPLQVDPAHLLAVKAKFVETNSVTEAWRLMLRLRGFEEVKDPRTKKARSISKAKVGELLGVYKPSGKKSEAAGSTAPAATAGLAATAPAVEAGRLRGSKKVAAHGGAEEGSE